MRPSAALGGWKWSGAKGEHRMAKICKNKSFYQPVRNKKRGCSLIGKISILHVDAISSSLFISNKARYGILR